MGDTFLRQTDKDTGKKDSDSVRGNKQKREIGLRPYVFYMYKQLTVSAFDIVYHIEIGSASTVCAFGPCHVSKGQMPSALGLK